MALPEKHSGNVGHPNFSSGLNRLDDISLNVNGQLMDPQATSISPLDRSYMYGDSLYEVIRTLNGAPFHMEEHFDRLECSAKLCHLKLDQSRGEYRQAILETLAHATQKHGQKDFYCRLIVSRGVGRIGFGLENLLTKSQYSIIVFPLKPVTTDDVKKGMSLWVSDRIRNDPRALDPAMKSGNYLNSLLAFLEAKEVNGGPYDDAILANHEGFITEGTTFNIFYVKNRIVATPPLQIGILQGITRLGVLENARNLGYRTREVLFKKENLYSADEVFVTSTLKGVFPVTRLDAVTYNSGRPGEVTLRLRAAYENWSGQHVS